MAKQVLVRLLETYFRHRWLYLLPILVLLAAGTAYALTAPPKYISQGVMRVEKTSVVRETVGVTTAADPLAFYEVASDLAIGSINELMATDSYIRAIIQDSDLEAKMIGSQEDVQQVIGEARDAIWANKIGNTSIVIAASHEDPFVAHQLATSAINKYIEWSVNSDIQANIEARDFLAQQLANYKAELDGTRGEKRSYLETHPAPLRGDRPETELLDLEVLDARVAVANQNYADTLYQHERTLTAIDEAVSNAKQSLQVVDAPAFPEKPATGLKTLVINVAVFGIIGTVLMMLCVIGGAIIDRSFRFPVDVQRMIDLPVLATVPAGASLSGGKRRRKRRKKRKK